MSADFHAILLILVPSCAALGAAIFGKWPRGTEAFKRSGAQLGWTLLGYVLVTGLLPFSMCGDNAWNQRWIPLLSVIPIALMIRNTLARRLACTAVVALGATLTWQFHFLIADRTGPYTGDPQIARKCRSQVGEAQALWHTPLTGLYEVRRP